MAKNERFSGRQSTIQIKCSDHCFHRIRKNRRFAPPTRNALGSSKPQVLSQINLACNLGQGLASYQGVEPRRQFAFGCVWVRNRQSLGNHQPKNPVPQKLQSLIVLARRAGTRGMGQRLFQ